MITPSCDLSLALLCSCACTLQQHPHVLNNEYYFYLSWETNGIYDAAFEQVAVHELEPNCIDNGTLNGGDNLQWIRTENGSEVEGGDGQRLLMLNTDLSLSLRIDSFIEPESGEVSCAAPGYEPTDTFIAMECPQQIEDVLELLNEFATDNEEWLEEFAEAFEEMITVHLDTDLLQQLTVPYDRSFQVVPYDTATEGPGGDSNNHNDGYDLESTPSTHHGNTETTDSEAESTTSSTESEATSTTSSTTISSTSSTEIGVTTIAMRNGVWIHSDDQSTDTMKQTALKYVIGPGVGALFVTLMYVLYKRKKIKVLSAEVTKTLVNGQNVYGSIDAQDAS